MGIEENFRGVVARALRSLAAASKLPAEAVAGPFSVERPKRSEHGDLATNAALELSNAIGAVLKTSADQHLDLFQGTYDVTQPWQAGDDRYQGEGTQIVLARLAAQV